MRLKLVVSESLERVLRGWGTGVLAGVLLAACASSPPKQSNTTPQPALPDIAPEPTAKAAPPASPRVREAEGLLARGDAEGARAKFDEALASDPRDVRALLGLGLAHETLGSLAQAERAYRQAIAVEPELAEAHNNLALLLRARGAQAEAIAELERATRADPKLASAQTNLALALEDEGRRDEARAAYARAVELAPRDAMLRANHGLFLLAEGQGEAAVTELRAGLASAGEDRAALLAIGNGLRRAGQPDEAVRAVRGAIEAGDGKPTPALLSELSLAQLGAKDASAAKASLNQALALDPKYATAHFLLGSIDASAGDVKAARAHFERCLQLEPKGPLADKAKQRLAALGATRRR